MPTVVLELELGVDVAVARTAQAHPSLELTPVRGIASMRSAPVGLMLHCRHWMLSM